MEPLIYNNAGHISLIRTPDDYVRAVLHDSEAIEARRQIQPWDNQGRPAFYEDWTIWFKDRYSWHCCRMESGLHESEESAWESVMNEFDHKGYTGSDNARFESVDSINDFIAEIKNDEDYAEELKFQQAMLAMLEISPEFSSPQKIEV